MDMRTVKGSHVNSLGFDVIDKWGRMVPDPDRWPSSRDGKGFAKVAEKVHSMGLKFGIHVMRGISTQAFNANTPILDVTTGKAYEESGRQWFAKDIGIKERTCAWMQRGFMSVNTKLGAGRAFLRSLYQQYAEWGVDFVKHDCVFGADLDLDEISSVSKILTELNRPMLYSLSPGTGATPAMARDVSGLANMYRITGDDWDTWGDVAAHFNVTRDFAAANMIGAKGLRGKSWPDSDMLPLGWLSRPGAKKGPHRKCNLTLHEQRTQFPYNSSLALTSDSSYRNEGSISEPLALSLTSCEDVEAKGWSARALDKDFEQVCWNKTSSEGHQEPFCLYKRKPLLDDEVTYKRHFDGKVHLLVTNHLSKTNLTEACLGASPNQKLTSKELKRGSLSPCGLDANQMWELTQNGTLMNSYSGLCASMRTVKAKGPSGIRAWIATGRRGEIYVAFFNLHRMKADISMRIIDLAKALPDKDFKTASCKSREEWSGKDFGVMRLHKQLAAEKAHQYCLLLNLIFWIKISKSLQEI
ncbi:hypothetical protein DH2020_003669 [Rehmannia glutinosa]|uniref:Alpha-galactosidase n=1 Tax=Rehmannia glutinosa TaxID=99300 RepID=A0ABR0XMN1_REHGL